MNKTENYKSGFVNIVGNPNVGKSTLMNQLVGDRLSIITNKSQTTRHRIIGIVNSDRTQIVYSDTPGVLKPKYRMQEDMLSFSRSALEDADILLYVTDTIEKADKNADFVAQVAKLNIPVLVLINKADLMSQEELAALIERWRDRLPNATEILPLAALHGAGIPYLKERIPELLPVAPPYFDEDALTDRPARFFVSEIIREKIFLYYQEEIPYSCEVVIDSFKESDDLIRITGRIYVERESQKGIIIGKGGVALKKVSTLARRDLEKFFGKKIFLRLEVEVSDDWRNSDRALRSFGYESKS